jgi:transcriptional regulator with XRE-family HTH domain
MQMLKERRKALGWSQQRVADLMGVQQSSISTWEGGLSSPTLIFLLQYADALGMKVKVLEKLITY